MSRQEAKLLKRLEASTGIEPVYTDLQSAASPLRHRAGPEGASFSNELGCMQSVLFMRRAFIAHCAPEIPC